MIDAERCLESSVDWIDLLKPNHFDGMSHSLSALRGWSRSRAFLAKGRWEGDKWGNRQDMSQLNPILTQPTPQLHTPLAPHSQANESTLELTI